MISSALSRIARRWRRTPGFIVVAALTLAVGIGATTAIFTVVRGVLLRPLSFPDPDRLVGVWHRSPGSAFPIASQSPATYLTYREEATTFEDIALCAPMAVSVTGTGEPERIEAMRVTDGFLTLLRVTQVLGRVFTADDDSPRTPERAMLTYGYWQRKFGGDPSVVGRQLVVDGRPREIVGVLPPAFRFLEFRSDILLPIRLDRAQVFVGNFSFQGVARLKPGATLEQANAEVGRLLKIVPDRFPMIGGFTRQMYDEVKLGPNVTPLSVDAIGDVGRVLWVLLGTVALVLVIACANVANLFLVRAEGRQQELAIHAALGAGSRRLAWELLSESLVLGLVGGVLGLGLAYAGVQVLVASAPQGLPRVDEIRADGFVLLFTLAVSLFSGALFGLLPVMKFSQPQIAAALKEGGRLSSVGRERHRTRHALVITEIALAVILLVASGLMIRTFHAMRHVFPGFTEPEQVLTLRVSIPQSLIRDAEQTTRTHEQIARRIEQIPGVMSVGVATSITMDGTRSSDPVYVEAFPEASTRMPPLRRFKYTAQNYFRTMGNPIVAGRDMTWSDLYTRAPVAIVNEALAQAYWKDPRAALGKRIRQSTQSPWRTIVGVVGDERDDGTAKPAPAIVYWPLLMKDFWQPTYVERTAAYAIRSDRAHSETLLKEVQRAVWSVNPNLPVASVRTLDQIRAGSMAQTSFALVMLAIAAAVALLLGLIGIYGVIAYVVAQRTKEIGIRIALGAASRDVSGLFLRQGLTLTVIGIAVGVLSATGLTRIMSTLLFGVSAVDPITYAVVSVALGGTAILASYLPARRAARVDPVEALRWEA
jgi:predicted permease